MTTVIAAGREEGLNTGPSRVREKVRIRKERNPQGLAAR